MPRRLMVGEGGGRLLKAFALAAQVCVCACVCVCVCVHVHVCVHVCVCVCLRVVCARALARSLALSFFTLARARTHTNRDIYNLAEAERKLSNMFIFRRDFVHIHRHQTYYIAKLNCKRLNSI